jgi:hypothetical protein
MTSRLKRLLALLVAVATIGLVGGIMSASSTAAPPANKGQASTQVHGKADNGAVFNGTFTATSFENRGGQIFAVGEVTGKLSNTGNAPAQDVTAVPAAMPVNLQQTTGSCQILDLVLGPLDLNLLGLVVHLDTVHLNITAQSGPGNLLGNLLCAIAGLLDQSPLNLAAILDLLNQILGALG